MNNIPLLRAYRDNAVLAKEMWDKIGIKLTIEEVEGSTLVDNWYKDNFDSISGAWLHMCCAL